MAATLLFSLIAVLLNAVTLMFVLDIDRNTRPAPPPAESIPEPAAVSAETLVVARWLEKQEDVCFAASLGGTNPRETVALFAAARDLSKRKATSRLWDYCLHCQDNVFMPQHEHGVYRGLRTTHTPCDGKVTA